MPDTDLREAPGRPDVYPGARVTLDPGHYPRDADRLFVVCTLRESRTYVGGCAVGIQPLEGDRYDEPRELSATHIVQGPCRPPPGRDAVDLGGKARVSNGHYR